MKNNLTGEGLGAKGGQGGVVVERGCREAGGSQELMGHPIYLSIKVFKCPLLIRVRA